MSKYVIYKMKKDGDYIVRDVSHINDIDMVAEYIATIEKISIKSINLRKFSIKFDTGEKVKADAKRIKLEWIEPKRMLQIYENCRRLEC